MSAMQAAWDRIMEQQADGHDSSAPAYQSPLRHHRRNPSQHREVKETLNARSAYTNNQTDGRAEHHINQYIIKDEIGRGSFGAVHLAVDQYGTEYVSLSFLLREILVCVGVDVASNIGGIQWVPAINGFGIIVLRRLKGVGRLAV